MHRRVFSYAEYNLKVGSSGPPLAGSFVRENGRKERGGQDKVQTCPLRALSSPISGLVDRSLCSEFQLLDAVMEVLSLSGGGGVAGDRRGHSVQGVVRLFVSTAPCVSCIWVLRQFQLLLPQAAVEVANGEEAYLFST